VYTRKLRLLKVNIKSTRNYLKPGRLRCKVYVLV